VTTQLEGRAGPVVAATDWVKSYADQIRPFVPALYRVLGTDGFGRSDRRERLRHHFEVSRHFVALAALEALASTGAVSPGTVRKALEHYKIDPAKPDPVTS
jgi:pyruvate dehydrogenase E1 component